MSEQSKAPSAQEKAINEYLEALLLEVPDDQSVTTPSLEVKSSPQVELPVAEPETVEVKTKPAVIGLNRLVAEVTQPQIDTQTLEKTEVEVEVEEVPQRSPEIPEWARERFQCLLFKVSGLSLAVPLVKLNTVIPWNENITQTPNQTDWYLGLVQHLQSQVKVIDTALLVMPENRRDKIDADPAERFSHILLVDDQNWGLACDSIGDVIWLEKEDVKWRKDKTSRAWLQGTSLEHLCAIMDTEVFAQMLNNGS